MVRIVKVNRPATVQRRGLRQVFGQVVEHLQSPLQAIVEGAETHEAQAAAHQPQVPLGPEAQLGDGGRGGSWFSSTSSPG